MRIEQVIQVDEKIVDAFKVLIPQLVGREDYPTQEELESIVESDHIFLLAAIDDDDEIVGTLTIALYRIPTGKKAIIEDVVVDARARGKGAASMLMHSGIEIARQKGAKKIELTSNPTRIAANKMYLKLGFNLRETNFYRLDL